MRREIDPNETSRAAAYRLWMKAPNPMVTFFKTFDVTNPVNISKTKGLKFNMLLDYCIGRAAVSIKEFYILPVDGKLIQYDELAVNTIVRNREVEVNSCDLFFSEDLDVFNREYLKYTSECAGTCRDRDLSDKCMVIGTSAVVNTELDGVVNMYSGFNNPFLSWGRYRRGASGFFLPISFQFHHAQMDGRQAAKFLERLQHAFNTVEP